MKNFLLFLFAISFSLLNAQRNCGTVEHFNQQLIDDPTLQQTREEIETFTQNFVANAGGNSSRAVITIPVVVHVVYNTAVQNVSDAQIQSQIDVLNADFRKLNADWTSTPSVFQSLVADCEIQFCLAQRDPNGNATSGIIRKQTSLTSFTTNDNVKRSANGGDDAWPASSYLNLWVCPLAGTLLGYAQFPGGPATTDGVVITYTGFGTTGTAAAPFDKGRTATHEVGHWLNLYHIWGDDGTACTGSDNVNDTPNQADENYGCPAFPAVSCSNGPNGDMFMNYMDYTNDACMFMFTAGQKARMQALFTTGGARESLLASLGCQPPAPVLCNAVTGLTAASISANSATISWNAVSGSPYYNLYYKTQSSTYWKVTSTASTSVSLTNLQSGTIYNYKVETRCLNGYLSNAVSANFTTTGSASCTDAYESNNTLATAKPISPNTAVNALINSSSDNDYFSFNITAPGNNLSLSLTTLPANYDLRLYNSAGTQVAISQNTGTTAESIIYNNATAGAYYARVNSATGSSSGSSCYTLVAALSRVPFRQDGTEDLDASSASASYQLFPNPSTGNVTLNINFNAAINRVDVRVYNAMGQEIRAYTFSEVDGFLQTNIDMNEVPNGIYNVVINSPLGRETKKLLISK